MVKLHSPIDYFCVYLCKNKYLSLNISPKLSISCDWLLRHSYHFLALGFSVVNSLLNFSDNVCTLFKNSIAAIDSLTLPLCAFHWHSWYSFCILGIMFIICIWSTGSFCGQMHQLVFACTRVFLSNGYFNTFEKGSTNILYLFQQFFW